MHRHTIAGERCRGPEGLPAIFVQVLIERRARRAACEHAATRQALTVGGRVLRRWCADCAEPLPHTRT